MSDALRKIALCVLLGIIAIVVIQVVLGFIARLIVIALLGALVLYLVGAFGRSDD